MTTATDDIKELTLRKPVTVGNATLDKITLREPTALQLAQSATGVKNGVEGDIVLISLSAKIDRAFAEQLGARDFMEAARWLGNFTRDETAPAKN